MLLLPVMPSLWEASFYIRKHASLKDHCKSLIPRRTSNCGAAGGSEGDGKQEIKERPDSKQTSWDYFVS